MLRIPVESRAKRAASAWVEVDLGAVAHNVSVWRSILPKSSRLLAVVKSNGYGHGMLRVARTALAAGAEELVVASVQEGAALRSSGITSPILIAGPICPDEASVVVQNGLVASIGSMELAAALGRATRRYLPVHIEVDSGMTRYGVAPDELGQFVEALEARGRLSIAGVYTHFAGLGAGDVAGMRQQLAIFTQAVESVPSLRGVRRHVCNTVGAMLLPDASLDGVRIGGGLYGFDPCRSQSVDAGAGSALAAVGDQPLASGSLRPALQLKARVVGLRKAKAGDCVGYGGTFTCQRPTRLALLPIGYGDGLSREIWRGAEVLVRGRRAPIVGAISMNQTVVDVTDLPEVVFGEDVVLIGEMGGERVTAEDRVPLHGCAYEVTSLLQARLLRIYRAPAEVASQRNGVVPSERHGHGDRQVLGDRQVHGDR